MDVSQEALEVLVRPGMVQSRSARSGAVFTRKSRNHRFAELFDGHFHHITKANHPLVWMEDSVPVSSHSL